MNIFNRVALSLVLVLFIVFTLVVSLLPRTLIEWLLSDSFRSTLLGAEQGLNPLVQLAGALLGLLVAFGAFVLLLAELRPSARQSVEVAQVAGGTAELTNESIAFRVKRVAESIMGVRDAVPVVHSRGRSVDIELRLSTDPDIDIPQKTEEVLQAVRTETEGKMGVPIKSLKATIRHAARDARGGSPGPDSPPR